jgi:hypothetical protein
MTAETVAEPTVFVAGARYRVNRNHPQGARLNEGDTIQAMSLDGSVWRVSRISENDTPEARQWGVYATDVTPLPGFADRRIAELEAQVSELGTQLEAERVGRRQDIQRWQSDIAHIGTTLVRAANDNDMCGVFDSTVDEINGPLRFEIEGRQFEHEMERVRIVTVRVRQTGTYEGPVRDSDDLDEDDVSWPDIDSYAIREAVSNGDWSDDETEDDSFGNA